jgi:hypothetical protein
LEGKEFSEYLAPILGLLGFLLFYLASLSGSGIIKLPPQLAFGLMNCADAGFVAILS